MQASMSKPRRFCVCRGCGAWKETGSDLMSFFADYDMAFFLEQHLARCPVTGKWEGCRMVSEDDPNYQPLPADKQWLSETCPGYRPPQEPRFTRYTADIPENIIGVWWARTGLGGAYGYTMVLRPGGDGAWHLWNMGSHSGRSTLRWHLDGVERICFDGEHDYFQADCSYFEVGSFTNAAGEINDLLRIFDRGTGGKPSEFNRSRKPLEDFGIEP